MRTAARRTGSASWPATPVILAAALVLGLTACSAAPAARKPAAHRALPSLPVRSPLPPGFSASRATAPPSGPAVLDVAPVKGLKPSALHQAPFPRAQVPALVQAVVNQPVPSTARPLLISSALRPGAKVTVAAGDFPATPHDVVFILQGPGLRAQRLVAASHGIAAGIVSIPGSLSPGTWVLAVEDLSELGLNASRQPAGRVLVGITAFRVG